MDDFKRLIRTLQRLRLAPTLRTVTPDPEPRPRRVTKPRELRVVPDRPRVRLPVLEQALRHREVRWQATCRTCGVTWRGWVRDTTQPAAVLATLAVLRVPCPVCWARAWVTQDQATRESWARVPSWIVPRWR